MDNLLDAHSTPSTLIACLVVIMAVNAVLKVAGFFWDTLNKKNELSEQCIDRLTKALQVNTQAVQSLELRLNTIEKELVEVPKVKLEIKRIMTALRHLSGQRWQELKDAMEDSDV